jgi:hypothetical protein
MNEDAMQHGTHYRKTRIGLIAKQRENEDGRFRGKKG